MNTTKHVGTTLELTDQHKAFYRRFLQEIFVEGRLEKLDEFLLPSYVNHDARPGAPAGPEGVREIARQFRAAFPDLSITVEAQIAEGDLVCSRTTTRGTHRGELFGIPPTGRAVTMTGLTMVRMVDGRFLEGWVKNDVAGLMRQMEGN
jgi:predicted ester cyclase